MMNNYANCLPFNFEPSENDVVIGKGKKFFFHKGETKIVHELSWYSVPLVPLSKLAHPPLNLSRKCNAKKPCYVNASGLCKRKEQIGQVSHYHRRC